MQLIAALLGTLGIFLPLALCEKKYMKKHLNVTKSKQPTDKRWMGNFAQNFIKSQPVQRFSMRYNSDLFSQSEEAPNNHYEFNDGAIPFEEHQEREEQNFQGLKEIKVPKGAGATAERTNNENAVMFASDIAQYLKPGIGDDPSDMPGGLKSYGGSLNGVGLPIAGKLRSTKLNPVASFAEQSGEEMDSHKVLLSPSTAVIPAVIADSIRTDSSTTKLLEEMPGKISEVSASVAESSKAFTGNGESSMIVSSNSDPSPTSALTAATDNSVTAQVDTSETATNDQPSSSSSTETVASDKSKQEADTSATETKETKEPEKTNEPGIANDSDQTPIKPKKLKQSTGHSVKSNDTSKQQTENKRPNTDEGADKTSAKAVEVSTGHDVSIGDESPGNTTNEDDGVEEETEKTPNKVKEKLVSSLREALLENVKEMLNGENSKQLLEEAQAVSDDKPVNLTNNQDEDEGSAESVSPNKETPDSHYIDDIKDDKGMDDLGPKDADKQPANLLETNLMKIDKKKLVHLLATLMKRYKSNGTPTEEADVDETKNKESDKSNGQKGKEISKSSDSKRDEEKIDEETLQALKNETKGKKLVEEKEQNENKDDESMSTENKQIKLNNLKHTQKAVSRDFFDPYAQIGLTDPKVSNNPAVSNKKVEETPTGRHSVHINLFGDELKSNDMFRPRKEFEGKVEAESQRAEELVNEKIDKQKAKLESEVQKAHAKESLENEDLIKASKEMMRLGMKSHSEDNGKENEKGIGVVSRLEDLKIADMKSTGIEENGLVKGTQSSRLDDKATMETSKSLDGKDSTKLAQFELLKSAEKEKADAMKEAESVQAELAKEKEELRILREQAKQEKAKEEELKLANAELEAKDAKERAAFLEKVRIQQEKDSKQDEKEEKLKQSKSDKEEESSRITKISDKLKGEDVNLAEKFAGKAEFAAEKGERQLENAESESSSQLNVGRVIGEAKQKLLAKEKGNKEDKLDENRNQSAGKMKDYEERKTAKMKQMEAEKVKEEDDLKQIPDKMKANSALAKSKEDQKDLKISIAAEDEKNKNVDITVGKPNENEMKEVESIIEEKEKKVKSMNKETEEEMNRNQKELKEVEKEEEMKGKKENKEKYNDALNNNNKEEKEEEKKLIEKYESNEKKPVDEESNRYIHYISPDMVNAIAAKLPSRITEPDSEAAKYVKGTDINNKVNKNDEQLKGFSDRVDKEMTNLKDHREDRPMRMKAAVGEALLKEKTGDKLVADEKQKEVNQPERIEEEEGKDSRERSKEKTQKLKEQEIKQKNDEFMAIDGPNIETLIQHMEERMRQKKKEKDVEREQSKLSSSPKEIRKKSRYQQDDAYAQIGSLDPNVKRRKIGKKARKHTHHHHVRVRS